MSTSHNHTTKVSEIALVKQVILGVTKHLGATPSLLLLGQTFTPAVFTALLQSYVDLVEAIEPAKAAVHTQLLKERELAKRVRPLLLALRDFLLSQYGSQAADFLADFGFVAHKVTTPTPEVKAAAAAKRAATRKARHTMGSKQRKKVTGASAPTAPSTDASPPPPAGSPATKS